MGLYERLLEAIKKHSGMDNRQICEAGEHGADAGWPEFTYYRDTARFHDENERDVWELLEEVASGMGKKPMEFVGSFRVNINDIDQLKNALAWFALEEIGRWLEGERRCNDDEEEEENDEDE